MSRLTRDGTAESVSRDQMLRHVRGQGNIHFPCSADHEKDWQPYLVDPYSAICDYTYIHTTIVYYPMGLNVLYRLFGVLGSRCWTGSSLLDCHVLKGFGIYMIGILGRLY